MKQQKSKKSKQSKKQNGKARVQRRMPVIPCWLNTLMDPFNSSPCAVPDQATAPSCKATSWCQNEFVTNSNGVAAVNHGIAIGTSFNMNTLVSNAAVGRGVITYRQFDAGGFFTGPVNVMQQDWPNQSALTPAIPVQGANVSDDEYRYRPTAAGQRLTYCGPELQRGAEVICFLAAGGQSTTTTATGRTSAFAQTYGATDATLGTQTIQQLLNRGRRIAVSRCEDGSYEARWFPLGCPKYVAPVQQGGQPESFPSEHCFLFWVIVGDTTASSSATGNAWQLQTVVHWEIDPVSRYVGAIPPTPSPCDISAVEAALNAIGELTTVRSTHNPMGITDGSVGAAGSAWGTASNVVSGIGDALYAVDGALRTPLGQHAARLAFRGARQLMNGRGYVAQPRYLRLGM